MKTNETKQLNSQTILLGFFAVVIGLAGTYAVRVSMAKEPAVVQQPPPRKPPALLTVPLASRDIPAGSEISLDDIALYRMTKDEIKKTVKVSTFMVNPTQIIGKVVKVNIKRNGAFDTKDLMPSGKIPGVSRRLKPGLRAVTVPMTPSGALIGFATPGQRVDVLFHYGQSGEATVGNATNNDKSGKGFHPGHHDFNPPRRRDYYGNTIGAGGGGLGLDSQLQNATSTIIQDAEILAIDSQSTPTDLATPITDQERVRVTLAVAPRQAELLRVATGHGQLSLTLRSPHDGGHVHLEAPVTLDHILSVSSEVQVMEVYRGSSLSKVRFGTNQSIKKRVFGQPDTAASNGLNDPGPAQQESSETKTKDAKSLYLDSATRKREKTNFALPIAHAF